MDEWINQYQMLMPLYQEIVEEALNESIGNILLTILLIGCKLKELKLLQGFVMIKKSNHDNKNLIKISNEN